MKKTTTLQSMAVRSWPALRIFGTRESDSDMRSLHWTYSMNFQVEDSLVRVPREAGF